MSFQKAVVVLRLAEMAASRHFGVGLSEIEAEFGVDRRTAQRMTKALEAVFPNVDTLIDDERRKYWKLSASDARLMMQQTVRDSEVSALEIAMKRAERDGAANEVAALRTLRDRLLAAMPGPHARRAEADAEAILEAHGFASRPGPRVRGDPLLLGAITTALKGPHLLQITYRSGQDARPRHRTVEPYGLLLGSRVYLVAHEPEVGLRHFRLDRIGSATLLASSFVRDPGFDLSKHAARAFGSFHADSEYGEVVWRFRPEAADAAREFMFHPDENRTDEADGSLTVRFEASGHLEMAWHLYQWGDAVEVLAPEALRKMVEVYRRSDFPAFP